jgi:SAM-dependent methyltransferase
MTVESGFEQVEPLEGRNAIQEEHGTHPRPWFRWLFERLGLAGRVLELGCGNGELWQQNRDRLPALDRLVVSDRSFGMAQQSHRYLNDAGVLHSAWVLDAGALPCAEGAFERVLAIGLFDLVPDLPAALSEIRRVLAPGGWLLATAGSRLHLAEMGDLVLPFVPDAGLGGRPEQFGLENGEAHLREHFVAVSLWEYQDELVFDRAAPLVDYILSEPEINAAIPEELRVTFVSRVKQHLLREGAYRVQRHKGLFLAKKPEAS